MHRHYNMNLGARMNHNQTIGLKVKLNRMSEDITTAIPNECSPTKDPSMIFGGMNCTEQTNGFKPCHAKKSTSQPNLRYNRALASFDHSLGFQPNGEYGFRRTKMESLGQERLKDCLVAGTVKSNVFLK